MDIYFFLLIFFPVLEIYALFLLGAHFFIFRTLNQYFDLDQREQEFIKRGIRLEIRLIAIASIIACVLAISMDYLLNEILPNSFIPLIVFFATLAAFPNSFQNKNERVHMKRLEGVIIQCYMLLAVCISVVLILLFDSVFLTYLPVPPVAYLNLRSTEETALPIWFTLSYLFVYILPDYVYVGFSFYLANFCFLLWCRTFYYAFPQRFWWSIKNDKYVLENDNGSDVDLHRK